MKKCYSGNLFSMKTMDSVKNASDYSGQGLAQNEDNNIKRSVDVVNSSSSITEDKNSSPTNSFMNLLQKQKKLRTNIHLLTLKRADLAKQFTSMQKKLTNQKFKPNLNQNDRQSSQKSHLNKQIKNKQIVVQQIHKQCLRKLKKVELELKNREQENRLLNQLCNDYESKIDLIVQDYQSVISEKNIRISQLKEDHCCKAKDFQILWGQLQKIKRNELQSNYLIHELKMEREMKEKQVNEFLNEFLQELKIKNGEIYVCNEVIGGTSAKIISFEKDLKQKNLREKQRLKSLIDQNWKLKVTLDKKESELKQTKKKVILLEKEKKQFFIKEKKSQVQVSSIKLASAQIIHELKAKISAIESSNKSLRETLIHFQEVYCPTIDEEDSAKRGGKPQQLTESDQENKTQD